MSRPEAEVDEDQVYKLASIFCSLAEIADIVECSVSTLQRRFDQVIQKGRSQAKASLKRKQFEIAMKGDRTMLVWLGKIHLDQRENDTRTIVVEDRSKLLEEQARQIVELIRMP